MMSNDRPLPNRVKTCRQQRGWSQDQLAVRAGISRAAVSAIEIQRLVPSVASALALAAALDCKVEELFGIPRSQAEERAWAWPPRSNACRFWRARVGNRVLHYPTEPTVAGVLPHDGLFRAGSWQRTGEANPERTLVMASCDPAAGLLAREYERTTGFRLIPLERSSREALDLLRRGLVDVAGIHLAASTSDRGNARAARAVLGEGFMQVRFATWEEGLAVRATTPASSVTTLLQSKARWVGRAPGAGARACQDEVLGQRRAPRRIARDHRGVAEAIRCDWADVGVCLRLVAEEAGLKFIKIREEAFDLCVPASLEADPRVSKLIAVVRSPAFQALFPLPGYRLSRAVEFARI
jgi:molybdate-binding protein/transcriptional regulator with XRE-family HTH domain